MSRLPGRIAESGEYGSALASEIKNAGFDVLKTGKSPFHYTVGFPGSVDQGSADAFNQLFYGSGS